MCGISAIFSFAGNAADDLGDLAQMHHSLLHRGPDGEGGFAADAAFNGHRIASPATAVWPHGGLKVVAAVRRLRVSDLGAAADQPMMSADNSICVMLNGAIYNFRELAEELSGAGHQFRTSSDTEVVIEAYRRWGSACFSKFNGMWAILIVDLARRKLVGSRDRIGIKPLYYALEGRRVLFCSEPAPLSRVLSRGPRIETARLFEFLSGYPPRSSALSFFQDVQPGPAASWFELDLKSESLPKIDFRAYWDLAEHHSGAPASRMTFLQAAERYRELFTSSIAEQSRADAKVGGLLSGGLDTSTIVSIWAEAAAARRSPAPETFSIAWKDARMSERPFQEAVAAKAGLRGHTLELSPSDVWGAIDQVISAQGQPLLGQELIAQYHAYRLGREHGAVVLLDGSGSDEVQAGIPPYEAEMVMERLAKFQVGDVLRELRSIARSYEMSFPSVVRQYLIGPIRRRILESRGLPRYDWLDEKSCDTSDPRWLSALTRDGGRDPSHLNRLLYRETKHTNVPAVLMYSDRNSMAHSVEARFPFLDHRLVEFCFSLPASYKVGFGRRKRLLYETAKAYLPKMVVERKDKGKFVFLSNWMPLREHAEAIQDASRSRSFENLPWINVARLRAFVDDYFAGAHENAYAVWRIYTAARWFELNGL